MKFKLQKKSTVLILTSMLVLVASITIGIINSDLFKTYSKYREGDKLLSENKLNEAIAVFSEIEYYKDSRQLKTQTEYLLAKEYVDNNSYSDAIKIFTKLGDYLDSKEFNNETKYLQSKQFFDDKEYSQAVSMLEQIKEYKDSANLLIEASYQTGIEQYEKGNFQQAKGTFEKIKDIEDVAEYLNNISIAEKYTGTWSVSGYGSSQRIFNGFKMWTVIFPDDHRTQTYEYDTKVIDGILCSFSYKYTIDSNENMIKEDRLNGKTEMYERVSSSTTIPAERLTPRIGMMESEVMNSNWGKPEKINKTTTKYGTSEQWVYDGYKYIYLNNGIVTAIQE